MIQRTQREMCIRDRGNLGYIMQRGLILVIMAMLALWFGVLAGNMAAVAGAGLSLIHI